MPSPETKSEILRIPETIEIPGDGMLRHIFTLGKNPEILATDQPVPEIALVQVIPAQQFAEQDMFFPTESSGRVFSFVNIGTEQSPTLLQLRLEPIPMKVAEVAPSNWSPPEQTIDDRVHISLLMTNERRPQHFKTMARRIVEEACRRGIEFDTVIAAEALGPKIAQEIPDIAKEVLGNEPHLTSLQKGKLVIQPDGCIKVEPPKAWIHDSSGVLVDSGVSQAGTQQMLFLDQDIAAHLAEHAPRVLFVDDARLGGGTIQTSLKLIEGINEDEKNMLQVVGIATVLNEGIPEDNINGIPFITLTDLPFCVMTKAGAFPIPGTFVGVKNFYMEVPQ